TVVTGPPSPPSSLVQTRREYGVTSIYLPKNSFGDDASNTKRYLPPTRTSISQERRNIPIDFGTHHCLNSSGLVHASNTMRAGPLKVRMTTSSRSDFRSTVVRFFIGVASLSFLASIDLLLPFQLLDNLVQLVEACVPELAIPLDPGRLFLQSARADLAVPHAPDLLRGDEPDLLQDADVLLHAREGHVELLGKVRNRSVGTPELLQNAASGGVRERAERGIEAGSRILNHVVQYITHGLAACKGRPSARVAGRLPPKSTPYLDADSIDSAIPRPLATGELPGYGGKQIVHRYCRHHRVSHNQLALVSPLTLPLYHLSRPAQAPTCLTNSRSTRQGGRVVRAMRKRLERPHRT